MVFRLVEDGLLRLRYDCKPIAFDRDLRIKADYVRRIVEKIAFYNYDKAGGENRDNFGKIACLLKSSALFTTEYVQKMLVVLVHQRGNLSDFQRDLAVIVMNESLSPSHFSPQKTKHF